MKKENLDLMRGSGNAFRDLGHKNADAEQCKAILAAEIVKVIDVKVIDVKVIDREDLTARRASAHQDRRTVIAAADFSRIRNADLGRFTVDRLISILNRLGARVDVKIRVRPAGRLRMRLRRSTGERSVCPQVSCP